MPCRCVAGAAGRASGLSVVWLSWSHRCYGQVPCTGMLRLSPLKAVWAVLMAGSSGASLNWGPRFAVWRWGCDWVGLDIRCSGVTWWNLRDQQEDGAIHQGRWWLTVSSLWRLCSGVFGRWRWMETLWVRDLKLGDGVELMFGVFGWVIIGGWVGIKLLCRRGRWSYFVNPKCCCSGMTVAIGQMEAAVLERIVVRVLWLSLISPYSIELGFWSLSMVVVSCHSQEFNLPFCGQSNEEKLLHVVWRFWVMVLKGVFFLLRSAVRMYFVSWVSMDEVLLIWRYVRGLHVLFSVFSCCQCGSQGSKKR
ncbi:hypothetical protein RchiOBHm_Chr5g0046641 [Rosa chinensis]|uniref:Transmembrane protein n=1 Tax=Rosa chinensis TaxID=74649 RepID=A0A2P6QE50_ROSCH|nr:hypothetical protein RchiOBHm_Chr5g0046641 [Rosa chinensis]